MKIDRLYELFDQAIELRTSEQLDLFLDQHCAGDMVQRQELMDLLKAHEHGNRLLDSPTQAMDLAVADTTEGEGETIGNYKLLQKIGEGGMGIVFMAEQLRPIRRKVALKIIREGINSKQILARFEAEREALSRLEHPNATKILDAGVTQHGRPYFVMDLVRGMHITQYCNAHRLAVEQRLELMEKVCMVIHHAHQKGILHRDVKPSNVMITLHDGVPVPKVIDFGIAKALDRPLTEQTLFTRYGDLVGTPEYMSPEQAEMSGLDLDVRTDIYSLGVVLYELLTGSTPITSDQIKGRGLLKIFETIRDSEAELPSLRVTRTISVNETLADERLSTPKLLPRALVGDLDWITMKALAKDRNERYDSAAAMAKDIRNYLNGEPVDAAAPSLLYRSRKFYRKHRSISIVAAISACLLLVSTALSIYWAVTSQQNAQIASDKSAELEVKSQDLASALNRALQAEKKAEKLARAESRRATEANAQRAMIERRANEQSSKFREVMQKAVPALRISGIEPDSRIELSNPADRNTDNSATPTAKAISMEIQSILTEISQESSIPGDVSELAQNEIRMSPNGVRGQLFGGGLGGTIGGAASGISSSSVVIHLGNTLDSPILYLDLLLEEQRKTFGNRDVFVAETLYQRAKARMEPKARIVRQYRVSSSDKNNSPSAPQIESDVDSPSPTLTPADILAAENDLREALSILAEAPEVELQRIETLALLSQTLKAQGKITQATEFAKSARQLIDQYTPVDPLTDDAKRRLDLAKSRLGETDGI